MDNEMEQKEATERQKFCEGLIKYPTDPLYFNVIIPHSVSIGNNEFAF